MAECFIVKNFQGTPTHQEDKFQSHNILDDYAVNSQSCVKSFDDNNNLVYTIPANLGIAWYFIAVLITVRKDKMYEFRADDYLGYGRLAFSSYENGGADPYKYENHNTIGNFISDNHLILVNDLNPKYLYFMPPSGVRDSTYKVGIWICTDANRNGTLGTNSFSFHPSLREEK